ncbi:hypothetical protein GCM10009801_14250 [Streptomyces albiaxialis]|uniref:Tn3 transposase DDE domain-containing protein n=1 Tax=Streptomyces albiaxialis TaxID=329523 RepID=A0ABN2VNC4_9ACTN
MCSDTRIASICPIELLYDDVERHVEAIRSRLELAVTSRKAFSYLAANNVYRTAYYGKAQARVTVRRGGCCRRSCG